MKRILWILSALAVGSVILVSLLAADSAETKAAQQSAQAWLALVDAAAVRRELGRGAQLFKQALSPAQWESAARPRAGRSASSSRGSSRARSTGERCPGAPDGEYVVIQYASSFENKKAAVETVTPMKDKDGVWRVSGYFIK